MVLDIKEKLKAPGAAHTFAETVAEGYFSPAFGARSKTEIDLLIFGALIKAGMIDPQAPIYNLARDFNITPARVRNLLLNWQLRDPQFQTDLANRLRAALQKTRFSKDGTLLTFGVEDPLLREDVTARLRAKGVFADASFSKEIVRMPVDAFVEFLEDLVDADAKKAFVATLVEDKQLPDKNFKAVAMGVLGKLGEKVAGEVGKEIAGELVKAAVPAASSLGTLIVSLLKDKGSEAAEAVKGYIPDGWLQA